MKDEKFQILKLGTFQPLSVVFVSETIRDIEIWDEWTQYYFCKATTNGYLVHKSPINRMWLGYFLGQLVLRTMWTIVTLYIPVNPPPLRGSLPRKNLISRMDWVSCAGDINLPHTPFHPARSTPSKKIKYNKILTYILRSIFLEIPHLELLRWQKTPRDMNGRGV